MPKQTTSACPNCSLRGKLFCKKGFTLLEVLVALILLAVVLTAAFGAVKQNAENAAYLRDKTLAHWVAMNHFMDLQIHQRWPDIGKSEGKAQLADRQWFWTMQTTATLDKELRRVEIQVRSREDAPTPLALLTGYLALP